MIQIGNPQSYATWISAVSWIWPSQTYAHHHKSDYPMKVLNNASLKNIAKLVTSSRVTNSFRRYLERLIPHKSMRWRKEEASKKKHLSSQIMLTFLLPLMHEIRLLLLLHTTNLPIDGGTWSIHSTIAIATSISTCNINQSIKQQ